MTEQLNGGMVECFLEADTLYELDRFIAASKIPNYNRARLIAFAADVLAATITNWELTEDEVKYICGCSGTIIFQPTPIANLQYNCNKIDSLQEQVEKLQAQLDEANAEKSKLQYFINDMESAPLPEREPPRETIRLSLGTRRR